MAGVLRVEGIVTVVSFRSCHEWPLGRNLGLLPGNISAGELL
jgi:hypothetical protein